MDCFVLVFIAANRYQNLCKKRNVTLITLVAWHYKTVKTVKLRLRPVQVFVLLMYTFCPPFGPHMP